MKVLIAYDWSDCVNAYRLMERVLLGSVSYVGGGAGALLGRSRSLNQITIRAVRT